MPLFSTEKDQIRLTLLRELNPCFEKVSKNVEENGDDLHREFLQTLIDAIRESVAGKSDVKLAASS